MTQDGQPEFAAEIYREMKADWNVFYDEKGSIGKRYRRQDESGTPFCITVDHQSIEDQTVTLRGRDSTKQERVKATELQGILKERLAA